MESFQSKVLKLGLKTFKLNKMWQYTGSELSHYIAKKQASESHEPPKAFFKKHQVSFKEMNGHHYYVIEPLKLSSDKHIFYLHGGGFVYEMSTLHWEFIDKLIEALNCRVTVPIYPLSPKHKIQDVFEMLLPIYTQVIDQTLPENLVMMGDSAGGGLALSLSQLIKEKHLPQAGNMILISPTLDMTFSNPDIRNVEKLDPICAVTGLNEIMKWTAGELDTGHYLMSPLFGDLSGLAKISLFIGTHDILYPDTLKLKEKALNLGVNMTYHAYEGMIHVWPLFFLPESKRATNQIIEIIRE